MCLRAVADAFEGEWGYHLWMLPLPLNVAQLKVMALGGDDFAKVNKARIKAELFPVSEVNNVKYADKSWTELVSGGGVFFRLVHNYSIAFPEFADNEMIELINKIVSEHGKRAEVLHNEQYSIIYIYEPTDLPV